MKHHYFHCFFTYLVIQKLDSDVQCLSDKYYRPLKAVYDLLQGMRQVGSLAGAVHLSNVNVGVQKLTQCEQKSHVEQKGKCQLDFDFQYEYRRRNPGLSILLI